jgi:serine/threonine protein kinase
LRNPEIDQN